MKVFFPKVITFLRRGILTIFAVPLVLLIRLIRPIFLVRLGMIGIDRIGNVYPIMYYLSGMHVNGFKKRQFDIFYFSPYSSEISNRLWYDLVRRSVYFFPIRRLALAVDKINQLFPKFRDHVIDYRHPSKNEVLECVFKYKEPIFMLTDKEVDFGNNSLRDLGITPQDSFICFHTRDSSYLKSLNTKKNWTYHDYRDTSITNYLAAVEMYLDYNKCKAVRTGAVVNEGLASENKNIIDYSLSGKRTEFLDVFLGAKCRFFLSTDCGITIVPESFKRPVIYTNWVSIKLLPHYVSNGIIIMKKWYSLKEKRFLLFEEILKIAEPHNIDREKLKVKFCDNSSDEIFEAMQEMDARIEGLWESNLEDEELQTVFWNLYGKDIIRSDNMRIGAKFLRRNKKLLGL